MKIKSLVFFLVITGLLIKVDLANANDQWSKVIFNNETCWYSNQNGELIKKCNEKFVKSAIMPLVTPSQSGIETQKTKAFSPTEKTISKVNTSKKNQMNISLRTIFLVLMAGYIGLLCGLGKNKKSYEKNVGGDDYIQDQAEKKVGKELKILDKNHYYIMHDITLPLDNGSTQIDHIVFSERGIYVIETKSHKGWIFGRVIDDKWTQIIKSGKKYSFYSPFIQNANHIKYLENIANLESDTLNNVVVFTNPEMEFKTTLPNNVLKVNGLNAYIEQSRSNPISKERLYQIIGCIEFNRKERSMQTNNEHVAYVKSRFIQR